MKKLISGVLAILMAVSVSVTAFAAETTAYQDDVFSIVLSDSISQENATLTLNGTATQATYYTVPVGATFSIKGDQTTLGEIGRRVFTKQSDGTYSSTWTADPHIDGFWEATPDLEGKLVHLFAFTNEENSRDMNAYFFVGKAGQTPPQPSPNTPAVTSPSPSASVGTKSPIAGNEVKIDTGKNLTVKAGKTYTFKITSKVKPVFSTGNSKVFSVTFKAKTGNDYFYQVKAVGKAKQGTGFYLNGSKTPVTVATIS